VSSSTHPPNETPASPERHYIWSSNLISPNAY